jgi:hypothetical protein
MRIWIQRGHCFRRSGSTGTTGEQDYVSDIAHRAASLASGHTVKVALADEGITGRWDLFIALHCDGSVSESASGASIGYRDAAGRRAGTVWKDRFRALGWPYGFRGDNYTPALSGYYGTGWADRAGIPAAFILEHGFLTNPTKDRPWLRSETGRRAAAQALVDTFTILAGGTPVEPIGDLEALMFCSEGDTGQHVLLLQTDLRDLGYLDGEVDGIFGPITAAAVAAMRTDQGSTATHIDRYDAWGYRQLRAAKFAQMLAQAAGDKNVKRSLERANRAHYMHLSDNVPADLRIAHQASSESSTRLG